MLRSRPGETCVYPKSLASRGKMMQKAGPGAPDRPDLDLLTYLGRIFAPKRSTTELGLQFFDKGLAEPGRRRRDGDPGGFHGCRLGAGVALAAGNDRAGMA